MRRENQGGFMYKENDLVAIGKRENNKKRNYLVVNRLQGKHIPVKPSAALAMFQYLGRMVQSEYGDERLLLIGFAETATAVGAAVSACSGGYYMQTTREKIPGVSYLYFSEAHSHATEQKLVKEDIENVINKVDRIVFVEDEVTTGNTILNIIHLIRRLYPEKVKFSVASLLNGMSKDSKEIYETNGIRTHCLLKTNHDKYGAIAESFRNEGDYCIENSETCLSACKEIRYTGYLDARRVVLADDYQKACDCLWLQIKSGIDFQDADSILVLGTEEFMYPGLFAASKIEQLGKQVLFHATTRSPIVTSKEQTYPLHTRYQLNSVYDKDRTTYVYDLRHYDLVLIITDSQGEDQEGINSLANALSSCGNNKLFYIRWCCK